MNCPYCNNPVPPNVSNCTSCGAALQQQQQQYQQQQYQQYQQPYAQNGYPVQQKSTAALVLGVISLLAWLLPIVGFPVSIAGLILGGMKKNIPGIIMSCIGLLLSLINAIVGALMATGSF